MKRDTTANPLFFELLRVALGLRRELPRTYSQEEWDKAFLMADQQAVIGVLWGGVERLPKAQLPYMDLMMEWMGRVEILRTQSNDLEQACRWVTQWFTQAGLPCVILKGQGVSRLYPGHLLRTPGDVDVWVIAPPEETCRFLREHVPNYNKPYTGGLHTEFERNHITFEVHFTASYMSSPLYQKRLQQWLSIKGSDPLIEKFEAESVEVKDFPVPSLSFNLVYLVLHMYRHYLYEGIGMRHVTDYVILIRKVKEAYGERCQEVLDEAMQTLEWLGAKHFTEALMWVIEAVCTLEAEDKTLTSSDTEFDFLPCPPDACRGRMLLKAILEGGNFGKADKKNSSEYRRWGWKRVWRFISRNAQLFAAYPSEIGWHFVKRVTGLG